MQKIMMLTLIAMVGVLGWSHNAEARAQRVSQIPNGSTFQCSGCHVSPSGGAELNAFGQQVNDTLTMPGATGKVDWAAVYDMDADGDGASNGAELGDPAGAWVEGDPNPEFVSDPNDGASTPEGGGDVNPNNDDGNNAGNNNGGGDEVPDDETGEGDSADDEGCTVSPGKTSGGVLGGLLTLLGLAFLRRRR